MQKISVYDIEAEDLAKIADDNDMCIEDIVEMLMQYKDDMIRDNNLIVKKEITSEHIESIYRVHKHYRTHCPCCGKLITAYTALSRRANVEICTDCGISEALADAHMMAKVEFKDWDIAKCIQY